MNKTAFATGNAGYIVTHSQPQTSKTSWQDIKVWIQECAALALIFLAGASVYVVTP